MAYSEGICAEKHKALEEKIDLHNKRLNRHGERLGMIDKEITESQVQIKNLVKSIDALVTTLKWMIGLAVPSLLTVIGLLIRK
jgi:hypothetical protein